jgi:hypothetical protein
MKQTMVFALVLTLAGAFAAQAQQSTTAKTAKTRPRAARTAPKIDAVATQLNELKQAVDAQRQQIKQLSDQLQGRDQQIQQLQQRLDQSQAATTQAQSKAEAASSEASAQEQTVNSLKSDLTDLKSNSTNTALALQETQKNITKQVENPAAIHYKGITITPGGYAAAESVTRQRAASADINTPFTGIPFPGNELSKVWENNFTARQSRLSLLTEGKLGTTKLTGYYETDWLGTGVTSNNRQSNSYVNRVRQIWGQVALASGLSVTAGQMWSLVTEDKKGIENRQELPPLTIDPQYNVGFDWARQYGVRVVENFANKLAVGVAIEGPQATIGGRGFSSVITSTSGITTATAGSTILDAAGAGGGLFNFADTTGYTINKAPDLIAKAALDPGWGHYEVFGVGSLFRNRVYPCGVVGTNAKDNVSPAAPLAQLACYVNGSTTPNVVGAFNNEVWGGGGGANFRIPLLASKKLEVEGQGMAGNGTGRYGSAQLADLTFRPDGIEALIRNYHGMGGLEWHSAKWDVYGYYGAEYNDRTAFKGYNLITVTKTPAIPATATTTAIPATTKTTFALNQIGGYGSPFANNSSCLTETLPSNNLTGQFPPPAAPFNPTAGSCAGDIRVISEATAGFWYKFYNGPMGGLRFGVQYSYFTKTGWSGNNSAAGTSTKPGFAPHAVDNMVWTSIRYYIP